MLQTEHYCTEHSEHYVSENRCPKCIANNGGHKTESRASSELRSTELMDALTRSAADIKRAREALEKDPEIEGYCWNFEEAERQILNTVANIRREQGSEECARLTSVETPKPKTDE